MRCKYHKPRDVIKSKPKYISPVSKKRLTQLSEYRLVRDKYLEDNPKCEVYDCVNDTTNLHHKNGRNGNRLIDTGFFMSCCSDCHPKRIHENPKWARDNGYLI